MEKLENNKPEGTPPVIKESKFRNDAVLWFFGIVFLGIFLSLTFGIGKKTFHHSAWK